MIRLAWSSRPGVKPAIISHKARNKISGSSTDFVALWYDVKFRETDWPIWTNDYLVHFGDIANENGIENPNLLVHPVRSRAVRQHRGTLVLF